MDETKTPASGDILKITRSDQYRTVDDLFNHAQSNSSYFTLLLVSALIVTAGLLLGSAPIVIGGMLVAPILTPLLVIGLGLAVGELKILTDTIVLIIKSFGMVIFSSFLLALILGHSGDLSIFENTARTALLYFLVAIGAGVAGAFAWARKEISEVLPGVSIAVTLVPPLSLIGIWLAQGDLNVVRFYLMVLALNLVGIVIGSLVVFSLLKFSKIDHMVKEKAEEIHKDKEEKHNADSR